MREPASVLGFGKDFLNFGIQIDTLVGDFWHRSTFNQKEQVCVYPKAHMRTEGRAEYLNSLQVVVKEKSAAIFVVDYIHNFWFLALYLYPES